MKELINKVVKIIFNQTLGCGNGIIGTTCFVTGFENGFIIVNDKDNNVSYYAMSCIKSITVVENEFDSKEKVC
ncbi:MAG: hypothetical protein RR107_06020 [Clostridia bacterium]